MRKYRRIEPDGPWEISACEATFKPKGAMPVPGEVFTFVAKAGVWEVPFVCREIDADGSVRARSFGQSGGGSAARASLRRSRYLATLGED